MVCRQLLVHHNGQTPDRQLCLRLPHHFVVDVAWKANPDQIGSDLEVAEQKPMEVLVALFGVDHTVTARVTTVHEREVRIGHIGGLDLNQPVALGTNRLGG